MVLACGTQLARRPGGQVPVEQLARLPVEVDYGSEYRYRDPIVDSRTLAVVITQSGETADTLAALREAEAQGRPERGHLQCRRQHGHARSRRHRLHARRPGDRRRLDQGVHLASWSPCTCWPCTWAGAGHAVGRRGGARISTRLRSLPAAAGADTEAGAADRGRRGPFLHTPRLPVPRPGIHYPIALEGALKLKEISYIHAEGYPAGEMKHGPIALIDEQMPVVAIAPHDAVFEKMLGNIQEAKARGGSVIAITNEGDDELDRLLDPKQDAVLAVPPAMAADDAGGHDGAAAAAGVPHRGAPRLRCRSAAQPGQERYGRIAGSWQRTAGNIIAPFRLTHLLELLPAASCPLR